MGDRPVSIVKPPPAFDPREVMLIREYCTPRIGGEWFRWFAWHPVWTSDRGWRWLRVVWRRWWPSRHGKASALSSGWTFDNYCERPK